MLIALEKIELKRHKIKPHIFYFHQYFISFYIGILIIFGNNIFASVSQLQKFSSIDSAQIFKIFVPISMATVYSKQVMCDRFLYFQN